MIGNVILSTLQKEVKAGGEPAALILSFKIKGSIREVFNQKNWERAYNRHDNIFRIKIEITLKSSRKKIFRSENVRKASLFWTRNPKLPYRIWILIIKDDTPFYPSSVEEAKSLLFDVEKIIELKANNLEPRNQNVYASIKVSWGKHYYTQPCELSIESNKVELTCTK
jgi:hypothetical protein